MSRRSRYGVRPVPEPLLLPVSPCYRLEVGKLIVLGEDTELYLVCGEIEKFWALAKELLEDRPVELCEARAGYMHEGEGGIEDSDSDIVAPRVHRRGR